MADKKQLDTSKIDALYSWISYDLQKMKTELLKEMKYSSVQMGSLYQAIQTDKDKSSQAISQEIRYSYKQNQTIYDGLATMLTKEVGERLNSMDETTATLGEKAVALEEKQADIQKAIDEAVENVLQKLTAVENGVSALENVNAEALAETVKEKVAEVMPQLEEAVSEIKYSFMQHQAIYDGLTTLISGEVIARLDDAQAKLAILEQLDGAIAEVNARIAEGIALFEDADYKTVIESVAEKTEECVAEHARQVLDAVSAIPVAENVDYNRIVDEVGDKVLELLGEVGLGETSAPAVEETKAETPVEVAIDYDRIIYGTAEKVVESLPYPEKVNYRRIDESFANAVGKVSVQNQVDEDAFARVVATAVEQAVEKAVASINIDAIANAVVAKMEMPVVETPQIDYDLLADKVAERLGKVENVDYDKVSEAVAKATAEPVDYERIAQIVAEKIQNQPCEEPTYELVVDEEGVQAIAKSVSEELCSLCCTCETTAPTQAPVEETVAVVEEAEQAEETVAVAEEVVEEPAVEVQEEPQEESQPASEELAVTAEPVLDESSDQLVDAETGLVVRLKKSFTAKMKQSDEKVKEYYSDIKNELTSYKKINSNVSWHGDRFNYGRDTIAKVNICGKTLCFYLALDPNDETYKTTVYHQKNVGAQKAYESTPFMVKIKSDAAAKKALRLVGYLAEKLGATKEDGFTAVNYVEEYAYETTKQLFDAGYIKATKEKKVDLDF